MLCTSRGNDRSCVVQQLQKKKSPSSGSRSAAPSKVTNYCTWYYSNTVDQFGVLGQPHRSMYLVRLVRTHIYDFLQYLTLGQNPTSSIPIIFTSYSIIYDFGRNIGGRQAIYIILYLVLFMDFANTLIKLITSTLSEFRILLVLACKRSSGSFVNSTMACEHAYGSTTG